jgi:peptidoglycan L-alanyl-D-glutamate endopeptidase CwlK
MLTHPHSLELLSHVHPDIAKVIQTAWDDCAGAGLPFIVTHGFRTQEEQAALYAQGRTTPGKIVTWTMNSRHLSGHAVDLCIVIGGKAIWDPEMYRHLADHILGAAARIGIPVIWGGSFTDKAGGSRPDSDHFELNERFYT